MSNEKQKEIRYFSMFTGVGGFELGLERAKDNKSKTKGYDSQGNSSCNITESLQRTSFSCVGFSEINKYSGELLKQKFPSVKNWGDCTKINPNELPDFDFLCGGFPCQAFSIAGKRRGFEDTRGTMFFEIARILEVKRPKLILLENVKGLLNHEKGKTFSVIIQTLEELGYRTQWMVLNSKFFGVPQNRERVFIIGSLGGESRSEILPFRESCEDDNKRDKKKTTTSNACTSRYYKGGAGTHIAVLTPDRPEKRQNGRRFKEPGEPMFTLTGQDIHGVAIDYINKSDKKDFRTFGEKGIAPSLQARNDTHKLQKGIEIRKLTPLEFERLQGFPDNWTEGFSNTQRYKMMGNAVTVNVIKAIAERMFA